MPKCVLSVYTVLVAYINNEDVLNNEDFLKQMRMFTQKQQCRLKVFTEVTDIKLNVTYMQYSIYN